MELNGSGGSEVKTPEIAFLCKSSHAYWDDVKLGANSVAQNTDIRLIFEMPMKETADGTKRKIEELHEAGISGIAISTSYPAEVAPVIRRLVAKGLPCITIDTDIPDSGRLLYVGTNNRVAGKVAGDTLAKTVRFQGDVVICTGSVTAQNAKERIEGFREAIARYPKINIVSVEDDGENPTRAFNLAKDCLAKHEGLAAFFGVFSSNGAAAARAVKTSSRSGVHIVCFDVLKDTVEFIREGVIAAAIGQRPYFIGSRTVDLFTQIIKRGADYAARNATTGGCIDTGIDIITKDSLERYTSFLQRMGIPVRF